MMEANEGDNEDKELGDNEFSNAVESLLHRVLPGRSPASGRARSASGNRPSSPSCSPSSRPGQVSNWLGTLEKETDARTNSL